MKLEEIFNMREVETCARQFRELVHDLSYQQQRPATAIVVALGIISCRVAAQVVGGDDLLRMGSAMTDHIRAMSATMTPAFVVGIGRADADDDEASGGEPIH